MNKKDLRLRPIEVGGKLFQSLVDACQYYDLPRALVASRLSKQLKWTVDEAFGLTPRPNSDQRKGVIYLVTHRASDKQYVGGTMTTKEKRWAGHIGNPDVSNEHGLDFAVQQFGPAAFDVIALHEECSPFQLVALEKEEIARRNTLTPNGYNLNKGGAGFISSGRKITVNGVKYASVPEACAVLTVPIFRQMESLILSQNERNAHLVNHRLRLGWTPDEAFGIVPKRSESSESCIYSYQWR